MSISFFFVYPKLGEAKLFELIIVQSVAKNKKSFVLHLGHLNGITVGQKASFTIEDVSIVARAKHVTRHFSLWQVVNPLANVPFHKGQVVTYNNGSEDIWEFTNDRPTPKAKLFKSYIGRLGLGRGLTQSVSQTSDTSTDRYQLQGELLYEAFFRSNLTYGIGGRIERETITTPNITFISMKYFLLGEFTYHFPKFESIYDTNIYAGIILGMGLTATEIDGIKQSGYALILPGVKVGVERVLEDNYSLQIEGVLETLSIKENIEFRGQQTTNQTSVKAGIGLKKYF